MVTSLVEIAMEALWDSIAASKQIVASPKWHGEVLAAPKATIKAGEATFLSLDELRERLR